MRKYQNKSFISILELYFSKEYDSLISKNETHDKEVHLVKSDESNAERLHIPIKTGEIDLGIKVDIEIVSNVSNVDINTWLESVENVIRRNNWSGDTIKFLFKDLIKDPKFSKVEFTANFEENRKLVYNELYPLERVSAMLIEAEKTRQIHYRYIEEYFRK